MSTFGKPLTPTQHRQSTKPSTPTKSKSMTNIWRSGSTSSVDLTSSAKVLEEVNLLLYLEALKRSRDTKTFLKQKVEEAYKLFEERRQKYYSLVAKYVELVKLASTRKILLRKDLIDLPTQSARPDADFIKENLNGGSATDYINPEELNKFKQILHQMAKYENIPIRSSELADLQKATDDIHNSIEAIEILLEKCITQGIDHFTDMLDMSNFPNLQMDDAQKE